ncbi:hypothetical protein [Candidatus Sororendozoicomonas aggregata]|uniref:hypothetical protein n=1 Tax=Candidatus Sororendozoicomonas aggregata TaxID=3073239 RepID=UPI002ED4230C
MKIYRRYSFVVFFLFNLIAAAWVYKYFDREAMYYCGRLEEKPVLAYNLSPYWFDNYFQFNLGYKQIISSSNYPYEDRWVLGANIFKMITKYDTANNDDAVLFKAFDWQGVEKKFSLIKLEGDVEHAYKVSVYESDLSAHTWVDVDPYTCRIGIYSTIPFVFLFFLVVADLVFLLKLRAEKETKAGGKKNNKK